LSHDVKEVESMPIHDWARVGPGIFHDFHHEWVCTLSRALNGGLLPARFYALIEPAAGLESRMLALDEPWEGFTALAEIDQYARKRSRVAVRHSSGDQVVALVEIMSPGNKISRRGLRSFVDKALEFLEAGIHLLVLDLFPPGPHDPQGIHAAIWSELDEGNFHLPADKPLTLAAYSTARETTAYIEPVAVGDALPDMPLFLGPEVYVSVPLDATYRSAFEAVPKRWRDVLEAPPEG
jgi:hypothetical protein